MKGVEFGCGRGDEAMREEVMVGNSGRKPSMGEDWIWSLWKDALK